jgi:hypothetical protein
VRFFETTVGIRLRDAKAFGGFGNMAADPGVRRGQMLFVGEAAGLQDALFGFGMRYALRSGHLAGRAFVDNDLAAYEAAYRRRLRPWIQSATVNRYLYQRAGESGYRRLVARVCASPEPRAWLRRYYGYRWWTPFLYPIARAHMTRRQAAAAVHECRDDCDCTYCRCVREAAGTGGEGEPRPPGPRAQEVEA